MKNLTDQQTTDAAKRRANAERQRRFKQRQRDAGRRYCTFWASEPEQQAINELLNGSRERGQATDVHYRVPVPFRDDVIEVYAAEDSHEWRVVDPGGAVRHDTGQTDNGAGVGYGSPELALRQALIAAYSDPHNDADQSGWLYGKH